MKLRTLGPLFLLIIYTVTQTMTDAVSNELIMPVGKKRKT